MEHNGYGECLVISDDLDTYHFATQYAGDHNMSSTCGLYVMFGLCFSKNVIPITLSGNKVSKKQKIGV